MSANEGDSHTPTPTPSSPTSASRPTRARSPPASPAAAAAGSSSSYDRHHHRQHEHEHEDPQVAQDIDAARQMSRARAGSIQGAQLSPTSPRAIPAMGGRRPSMRSTDDPTVPSSPPGAQRHHPSSASYVSRSPHASRTQHHPSASVAARFYAQPRRQGSNTSLDSASHFIDHRSQPHFSGSHNTAAPISSSLRQASRLAQQHHLDESAVSDEPMAADIDDFSRSDSRRQPSRGSRHSFRQSLDRQRDLRGRSPHIEETRRRSSAAQDDVCFPFEARNSPQQQQAHLHGELGDEVYPDDQRVYEQMQEEIDANRNAAGTLPPGFPYTFDLQALEDYAVEERSQLVSSATAGPLSLGGGAGLRNRHRGVEAEADKPADGTYGISPDSDDATFYSRRPRRHASGNQNGGGAYGTPGSTQNQGRYQRKLALFESGGTAPPPHDILGTRSVGAGAPDANTPLLGADGKAGGGSAGPSYQPHQSDIAFGSLVRDDHVESKGSRMGRSQSTPGPNFPGRRSRKAGTSAFSLGAGGLGAPTTADKPYRFTFYSNALPSTIHARHLAELPAKGQSFEELFSGLAAGSLGGNGEEGEQQKSGESTAAATMTEETAAAAGRNPNPNGGTAGAKPDPSAAGSNPQASALAAQLAVRSGGVLGRKEGTTAPPTRTGTPVPGASARNSLSAARGVNAANAANGAANGGGGGGGMARTVPGGGIRMDQDPEANTWWLDVLSPTDQEMKLLSRVFGIHPLTTEDILMEETREKIELFRNYYLVCFRSFDQDPYSPTYLEPLNMYIIVFREGTLSFHFRATPHPQNVRRRIKQLKDYINVTSDWISYALIDDITDAFGPLIQSIEYEVDSIDELVLILKDVEQSDMLRRIGACRKKVMGLLRLMGNKADVVKGLAKRCNENWSVAPKSDIGLYLSDIQDHLITMTQNLSHFEKILSRSHSNYLAQISIEMTEANNRANDVLSKLTALGTVIVPLNVITGLWGMNVNVPGQDVPNLNWFGGLVAFMIAIACGGYWVAIRYLQR